MGEKLCFEKSHILIKSIQKDTPPKNTTKSILANILLGFIKN